MRGRHLADTYINLGEIQAASASQASDSQGQSTGQASAPGSSPASVPPAPPGSEPVPPQPSAPSAGPASLAPTPPASVPPPPPPPLLPPPPPPQIPPPVPAENAVAAVTAPSPPKEEAGGPVAINPVHAPNLKLFEDVNLDSDAKSAQNAVGSKKGSKGSASDGRKKKKRNGTSEDDKEYKKPKQYYFARGCYGFCFILFLVFLAVWGVVAAVALHFIEIEFFENLIMNFG